MSDSSTAESDLAFMKALVEGDHKVPEAFGSIYAMSGLVYSISVVLGFLQMVHITNFSPDVESAAQISVTVLFLILLAVMLRRFRDSKFAGVTARTFAAGFAGVGCAAITMVGVLLGASWRLHNPMIFEIMPAAAFALQGAAWMVAYIVRQRPWFGIVAFGWFAAAIGVSVTLNTPALLLVVGFALVFLMFIPGVLIVRAARAD